MRTCKKCGFTKDLYEFSASKSGNNGRSHICKECAKKHRRNLRYGLMDGEFEKKLRQNGYQCEICRIQEVKSPRPFHQDHDHSDGSNRGIICHHCNVLLGMANDTEEILEAAILYLKSYRYSKNQFAKDMELADTGTLEEV